ncbi:Dyp-type peroxidase [Streptomyces koyangensis]|uniref:Dyp-type peroxidase n=1 Tax=Streptomyces koyangensis TaxID=188770 RepID=UPI003C2E5CEC
MGAGSQPARGTWGPSPPSLSTSTPRRARDDRDLLEFADGTANPDGTDLPAATLVGDEDPAYAGGSYVVVQKYPHDLPAWRAQTTGTQEEIIGRTKFDNVAKPDATEGQKSHKTLCSPSTRNQVTVGRPDPHGRPGQHIPTPGQPHLDPLPEIIFPISPAGPKATEHGTARQEYPVLTEPAVPRTQRAPAPCRATFPPE